MTETVSTPKYAPFRAILNRIVIRVIQEETDDSGIVIPRRYRQQSNKGVVVSVGDFIMLGGQKIPVSDIVKPGDVVLFGQYNAEEFHKDGESFWLVMVEDIRGVERLLEGNNG